MREVEFVPFRLTDNADIYSIRIDGRENTEFQEFMINFKDTEHLYMADDFNRILKSISTIIEKSAKEYYFRPEGNLNDRVQALPLYTMPRNKKYGTLRLYCIRIQADYLYWEAVEIKLRKPTRKMNTCLTKFVLYRA